MGLSEVVLALQSLEESIEIPVAKADLFKLRTNKNERVARAYLVSAEFGKACEVPCFMNWPDTYTDGDGFGQQNIEKNHTIQIDCFAPSAEWALAMFDALENALQKEKLAANRLGQTVGYLTLRAERPLIEVLTWNGLSHPGFHLFVDFNLFEAVT